MARITHVKAARQRYATIPVIDPTTGEQKQTPVMVNKKVREDNGEVRNVLVQKQTKSGRPVFMKVTEADKTQPLPNHICDCCRNEIPVGAPYKHVTPKSGPYGGHTKRRCANCPSWQVWELSNSLSSRVAEIVHNAETGLPDAEDDDEVVSILSEAAEAVRALAEEKRESAENIREGFGHETSASEELDQTAESLDGWADEVEGAWDDSKFDWEDERETAREELRSEAAESGDAEESEDADGDEDQDDDGDDEDADDEDVDEDLVEERVKAKWAEEVDNEVGSILGGCPV